MLIPIEVVLRIKQCRLNETAFGVHLHAKISFDLE